VLRDAAINDLPRIVEIYNQVVPTRMVTADLEPVSVQSRLNWFQEHDPQSRPLWVYEMDNEIVGWASFQSFYGRPAYRHTAEISIYIDEKHHRKGIGSVLLDTAISKCHALEIQTLLGFIFGHNEPSLKLFRKKGFETWGHFPRVAVLDGIERDLLILGLRVYNSWIRY
jgi:L-amino acid N-acyltransferase YncA